MQTIAAARDHWGTGLGARLLTELLRAATAAECARSCSRCGSTTPAPRRLYERFGFEPIGFRKGYYQPGNVDALVMRLAEPATGTSRGHTMADEPLVLGIETSCDETGVGIVRGHTLLADAVASSVDEHARFGGVVPEVACRAHLEAMVPTIQRALADAGVSARDLDGIAVTAGPGLAGALLVGVSAAKAYAYALGKPLYGVNHLASHICVDQLEHGPLPEPTMALLVSGGHSSLLLVPDITGDVRPLGATIDDAAGEAFDKVARVLGLGFPGGPVIDRHAREGDPTAIAFPRGLTGGRDPLYDFSFSGLKTAVARWVEARAQGRRGGAGRRRGRVLPGGGGRRAHPQGRARLQGQRRRPSDDRRRRGRQLPAARAGAGALRGAPGSGCGCRGPDCARTTARWSPRSAPRWSPAAAPPPPSTCRRTPRCRSPRCPCPATPTTTGPPPRARSRHATHTTTCTS